MQNYSTQNFSSQGISRYSALLFLAVVLAVLAGCGSGGAGGNPASAAAAAAAVPGAPPPIADAATLQLLASNTQMPSSVGTTSTIDLTAIVLSPSKQTISGKTVNFSTLPGETAFISNISAGGVSDANGFVTAKLFLGSDRSNRTITVTATADSAITTNNIDVTGTTINISGVGALAFSSFADFTLSLKDSAQNPILGTTLSVASKNGNTITPATGVTNSTGQVTVRVTATAAGVDVITVTGAGASKTQNLTVSSDSFAFTQPAAPVAPATSIDIPLSTATPVLVNWKLNGQPVPIGSTVSFATTRGQITPVTATTDAAGNTSAVTVSSLTSGPAIISASGAGTGTPATSINVIFVAKTATNVTAQAVPGTIQFTTGVVSQTSNASTISAVVRDPNNNLVKDASVSFNITSDPSGGGLSAPRAITDFSGTASVIYTAGTFSSAQNGVLISATVTDIAGAVVPPVTGTTTMTVSGQPVLVRLGSDNLSGTNSPVSPTYSKTFAAIVTDTAGNPAAGTAVHFALRPGRYRKGFYFAAPDVVGVQGHWELAVAVTCPNEDRNFNSFLDTPPAVVVPIDVENQAPGQTGFGSLEPGMPASVNATGTTDAKGVAIATITFPKNHANWTEVTLEARTGVTSNDPPAVTTFFLPVLSIDVQDVKVDPPGRISPWGEGIPPNDTCGNLD